MARQPSVSGDNGTWGTVLNEYLSVVHEADGTLKAAAIAGAAAGKIDASTVTTKGDLLSATASATLTRRGVGSNGAHLAANSANADGLAYEFNPHFYPLYKSGFYYFCNSPGSAGTSITQGNSTARATPFAVAKSVSITRLGCEFTVAGEANSVIRLGIYNDDGTGLPGTVALDAGTISTGTGNAGNVATGGTPGVYEITVSTTLPPGMYWAGAAVQGAAATQPTMRIVNNASFVAPVPTATIPAANAINLGYQMAGVSGALTTWSGTTIVGSATRMFFKVA